LATFEGFHERSVCSLGFSPDGNLLLSVGSDDKNSICIYDLKSKKALANSIGGSQKILLSKFFPNDNTAFVTAGVKSIKFWKLDKDKLSSKDGIFKSFPIQSFNSITFSNKNEVITGANSGDIYIWNSKYEAHIVISGAHKGIVSSILSTPSGIISSSKDGLVHFWGTELNSDSKPQKTVDLNETPGIVSSEGSVCARAMSIKKNLILIGTRNSEIIQLDIDSNHLTLFSSGHFDELWGLATHPTKQLFVTGGKDQTIRSWDIENRKLLNCNVLKAEVCCADISTDGVHVVAGLENGEVVILETDSLKLLQNLKVKDVKIDDVKFSPDGTLLAIGCHNGSIDIYQFKEGFWKEIGTCKGSSTAITHLDWSKDGKLLQSDSASYEHLFWDIEDIQQVTKTASVRNVHWATWTCVFGWSVKGIWPKGSDGTDINAVSRSNDEKLLATSDDFGQVKLFRFPCVDQTQKFRSYDGHSSHVTNVRFAANDAHLISTGGNDRTVFQWKVIPSDEKDDVVIVMEEISKKQPSSKTTVISSKKTPTKATGKETKVTPKTTPVKATDKSLTKKSETVSSPAKTPTPKKVSSSNSIIISDKDRIDRLEKRVEELEHLVKKLMDK